MVSVTIRGYKIKPNISIRKLLSHLYLAYVSSFQMFGYVYSFSTFLIERCRFLPRILLALLSIIYLILFTMTARIILTLIPKSKQKEIKRDALKQLGVTKPNTDNDGIDPKSFRTFKTWVINTVNEVCFYGL